MPQKTMGIQIVNGFAMPQRRAPSLVLQGFSQFEALRQAHHRPVLLRIISGLLHGAS